MEIVKQPREVKIVFNLTENQELVTTDELVGHLDSVIIDSREKCAVIIKSQLGYLILHTIDHEGVEYYAPRAHMIAPERNLQHNYQFDKFLLNEALEIMVYGLKGDEVKITIRIN